MSSGSVQITIAIIGVIGSVAVAYITTGAAFESKLKADAASISELRDSIRAVSIQLTGEVRDAQQQIAKLIARLDTAHAGVDSLVKQVSKVDAEVQRLHLNPGAFEQPNKKPAH